MVLRGEPDRTIEQIKQNIELGSSEEYTNGPNNKCKIFFYVTQRALIRWIEMNPSIRNLAGNTRKISYFKEKNLLRFKTLFMYVFRAVIRKYGAFPSMNNPSKEIYFFFNDTSSEASCQDMTDNFRAILVQISIYGMHMSDTHFYNVFKHELFHMVAEESHGEAKVREAINEMHNELSSEIESQRNLVEGKIGRFLDYLEKTEIKGKPVDTEIVGSVDYYYEYSVRKFWNIVSDSALMVIAMDLEDAGFINFWIEKDREIINKLKERLIKINKAKNFVLSHEENHLERELLLSIIKVIEYIECFNGMPFFGVAYSLMGRGWRSKLRGFIYRRAGKQWHVNDAAKNIYEFEAVIKRYCEPDVVEGFMRFYKEYLLIVEAQNVRVDPLNPNVKVQIHNIESIRRAKKAYRTMNREFFRLFHVLHSHI